jgi:hypothetical protein
MKTTEQLLAELEPFIKGQRHRVFSEIEPLLHDILVYLTYEAGMRNTLPPEDPTITSQLELDYEYKATP